MNVITKHHAANLIYFNACLISRHAYNNIGIGITLSVKTKYNKDQCIYRLS